MEPKPTLLRYVGLRAAGIDDVAVVSEAIEHGGCHLGVAEHLRPIGESQIGW